MQIAVGNFFALNAMPAVASINNFIFTMRNFFTSISAMLMLCGVEAGAQSLPCKPIRANQGKNIILTEKYKNIKSTLSLSDGSYHIERDMEHDTNILLLYKNELLIQQLNLLRSRVTQPFITYQEDGEIRIDSLNFSRTGYYREYIPGYRYAFSDQIYATLSPGQGWLTYYAVSGKDSVDIWRFPNGALQRQRIYNALGEDSITMEWSLDGIFSSYHTPNYHSIYYAKGTLQAYEQDTLIERWVRCRREYSIAGILQSVQYRADDTPVHVWRYYNQDGTLMRMQRYRRPGSVVPHIQMFVEQLPPAQTIWIIDQPARPSMHAIGYIREGLTQVLCASREPLSGQYAMTISVDRYGKTSYESVTGHNSVALDAGLRKLFENMPVWLPYKEAGLPADVRMIVYLEVQ